MAYDDITSLLKAAVSPQRWSDLIHELVNYIGLGEKQTELAITVVLLDVALIDDDFDERERQVITEYLGEVFGVSEVTALKLISEARELLKKHRDSSQAGGVIETLKAEFTYIERKELIDKLNQIVKADGVSHPFEKDLQQRYARLLGMPLD